MKINSLSSAILQPAGLLMLLLVTGCHPSGNPDQSDHSANTINPTNGYYVDIKQRIKNMTLEEKIGQKIMMDFRYWNNTDDDKKTDMIVADQTISDIIHRNHIGGVILYSNNLKDKQQINNLTSWYSRMRISGDLALFIATDNEGGNVFRLPRTDYASFPGNMALAAAIEGGAPLTYAQQQGAQMAYDMLELHINTNLAPVVDVNTNPLNPVINVRAYSDDVTTVATLASHFGLGMRQQGLIYSYKHFPGHGSTATDSHTGLPAVDRDQKQAYAIDIAPYKMAIDSGQAPDMIMTAHIQYPSLDNSLVTTRSGESIIVPATMSRRIQTDILRNQLGYQGVTISDALDMGAIADHFSPQTALMDVFRAGVDIALMPVRIYSPKQADALPELIKYISHQVRLGVISEAEIDASVERILLLKQKHGLITPQTTLLAPAQLTSGDLEQQIADHAITLVVNKQQLLPLTDPNRHYFILTENSAQADGIARVMQQQGYLHVVAGSKDNMNDRQISQQIDRCDIFLQGTLSTHFSPVEHDGIVTGSDTSHFITPRALPASWFNYANSQGKKTVHLALRAPYDIASYDNLADAAIATYSFFGYADHIWQGKAMIALANVLTGRIKPTGKLPVNIWYNYNSSTHSGNIAYPRGFGLSF